MQVKPDPDFSGLPDLTGTSACAAYQFRRTSRAVARLYDAAIAVSGIRSTQFAILTAIAKLQPVAISRVAEILVIDSTTMTRSLRVMQKDGLIEIAPRGQRRQRLLTLTLKAEKALAVAVPLWRKAQARFLDSLGGKRWKQFQDELEHAANVAVTLENEDIEAKVSANLAGCEPQKEIP
ncbi:MAG TPA: MarR family winged helix-turn-helix transcriptional regulator [Candidatus Acidoferrum sp.]|nr:MarR family winged helix-turn-helix transcriptional regulator [Candidatus Acidoferrum sp.]